MPKKLLAPPNQETVERTRCFFPPKETTSKPREGEREGGREGGVQMSLSKAVKLENCEL